MKMEFLMLECFNSFIKKSQKVKKYKSLIGKNNKQVLEGALKILRQQIENIQKELVRKLNNLQKNINGFLQNQENTSMRREKIDQRQQIQRKMISQQKRYERERNLHNRQTNKVNEDRNQQRSSNKQINQRDVDKTGVFKEKRDQREEPINHNLHHLNHQVVLIQVILKGQIKEEDNKKKELFVQLHLTDINLNGMTIEDSKQDKVKGIIKFEEQVRDLLQPQTSKSLTNYIQSSMTKSAFNISFIIVIHIKLKHKIFQLCQENSLSTSTQLNTVNIQINKRNKGDYEYKKDLYL